MQKIAIIGSGGSGKSTLSTLLGEELGLPVYHLDKLYWKPGWVKPSKEDWIELQKSLCEQDRWIIDGNYRSTFDIRLDACDTVIFLDVNRYTCVYRAIKRSLQGRARPDMPVGCKDKLDLTFIKFLWDYPKDTKPIVLEKLEPLKPHKNVIIARSGEEVLKRCRG